MEASPDRIRISGKTEPFEASELEKLIQAYTMPSRKTLPHSYKTKARYKIYLFIYFYTKKMHFIKLDLMYVKHILFSTRLITTLVVNMIVH